MNANELADMAENACCAYQKEIAAMLRQQQAEIEALKQSLKEIIAISDRKHDAWGKAKGAIEMNANELLAYNSGYTNGLAQVFKFSEENDKLKTEIEALKTHIEKLQYLNRDGWYYATELKNELEKVQK